MKAFRSNVMLLPATLLDLVLQVTYALHPNGSTETNEFSINRSTGMISTRQIFDRETKDFYILKVYAMDGAPSSRFTSGAHNTGRFRRVRGQGLQNKHGINAR